MSAVVVETTTLAYGRAFRAPRRARLWALGAGVVVVLVAGLTVLRGQGTDDLTRILSLIGPFFCCCVAGLGVATRSAALRVDTDGVAWGWGGLVVRMRRAAVKTVRVYAGARTVALVPKLGLTWHLAGRDWEGFAQFGAALRDAGFPVEELPRPAPFLSRLQGYGLALDLLLFGNLVLSLLVFSLT
jgi:hypothetical protein